jgi:hypothetical protein
LLTFALLLGLPGSGGAAPVADPPPGDISSNVEFVGNIPEMASAISIAFIKDVMFVSTAHGVYSYDVSDPAMPERLGALPMYIWENEDMTVDVERELIFISRDPRGFTTPATPGSLFPYGAVHIIDVSNPSLLTQVNVFPVPAGHTTTCVDNCKYIWTAGPVASAATQPADWDGRPIYATDVTDPTNPVECPKPIDTKRNDGKTDYVHDVQVDRRGIAWVSGAGGVRGYWTSGTHRDPISGSIRKATGCKPIAYAGGGTPESGTPSRFMHNAWRNLNVKVDGRKGDVLFGTEENTVSDCKESGRFATYDLKGSYRGEGFVNTSKTHFRMKVLDTWTPEGAKGATGCDSAHYFTDRGDGVLAYAFYGQGTRFLDASDPRNIRQVGYFRPDEANTWAAYWHDGYVFVADFTRGIDILRFEGGRNYARVAAPKLQRATASFRGNPSFGYLCPIKVAAVYERAL